MEFDTKTVTFEGASDLAVVGYDPERADYTFQRGEIHGFRPFVFATDAKGNRKCFYLGDAVKFYSGRDANEAQAISDARADSMAKYFNDRYNFGGKLPLRWAEWQDTRPEYCSEAYMAYGQADDLALEAREEEESYW